MPTLGQTLKRLHTDSAFHCQTLSDCDWQDRGANDVSIDSVLCWLEQSEPCQQPVQLILFCWAHGGGSMRGLTHRSHALISGHTLTALRLERKKLTYVFQTCFHHVSTVERAHTKKTKICCLSVSVILVKRVLITFKSPSLKFILFWFKFWLSLMVLMYINDR